MFATCPGVRDCLEAALPMEVRAVPLARGLRALTAALYVRVLRSGHLGSDVKPFVACRVNGIGHFC